MAVFQGGGLEFRGGEGAPGPRGEAGPGPLGRHEEESD